MAKGRVTTAEIEKLARTHSALAIQTLANICRDTKAREMARITAAKVLLDRGWGKAKVNISVDDGSGDDGKDPLQELLIAAAARGLEAINRKPVVIDQGLIVAPVALESSAVENHSVENECSTPIEHTPTK